MCFRNPGLGDNVQVALRSAQVKSFNEVQGASNETSQKRQVMLLVHECHHQHLADYAICQLLPSHT
jgi:hypothetical protein